MQPSLRKSNRKQKSIGAFKGLCLRSVTPDGYFTDAENLTSDGYPAILPRSPRGVITETGSVSCMYDHGEMCWIWDNVLFYKNTEIGPLSEGEKQFASLGAYVVIYPDKKILNTDTLTLHDMENISIASGARISACNADGSDASETGYAKIAASGIGNGFSAGDGISISGLTGALADGSYLLQTVDDDFLVVIASLDEGYEEAGEITVQRKAPDFDYICALDNRVWGCSSKTHSIHASRLGDPTNFEVFQGVSTDSYYAMLPSPGDFTGASADLGSVIFFKEEEIIRLYGTKPSNFQLIPYKMPGVEAGSHASLTYSESVLFYKGLAGVYMYDGSVPELISAFLGANRYTSAKAGAINGKYYIAMHDGEGQKLFVYDTHSGAWYRESAEEIRYFTRSGNELYFACADGKTYAVNGSGLWYDKNEVVSTRLTFTEKNMRWSAETGWIRLNEPEKQYVTALHIRFSLKQGAELDVYIRLNGEYTWRKTGSFRSETDMMTHTLAVPAVRCDSAKIRLEGTDGCTITQMIKTYAIGSEL